MQDLQSKKNHPYIMIEICTEENLQNIVNLLEPFGYEYIQIGQEDYLFFV